MVEPRSMIFNLSGKLEYSIKGDFETTIQLEMAGPSYETLAESTKLAQLFTKSIMAAKSLADGAQEASEGQDKDLDAGAVQMLMYNGDIDFQDVVKAFKDLAFQCCTLDADKSVKLTENMLKEMSFDDITGLIFKYIAVFIAPSVLSGLGTGD